MVKLPYLPKNREILYISGDNKFILEAKKTAERNSLDPAHKTGAVIVKNNKIIGKGANGSEHHEKYGCERKKQNIPTGEGYDLCEGCSPHNHAEQKAIANAQSYKNSCKDADLYLFGHWWVCESCWNCMIKAEIRNVYLEEDAKIDYLSLS